MTWKLVYTKHAQKDARKLSSSGLTEKAQLLLEVLKQDPYQTPPTYEKLVGDLSGAYSRRINIQHRLVYQLFDEQKIVKMLGSVDLYCTNFVLNRSALITKQSYRPSGSKSKDCDKE